MADASKGQFKDIYDIFEGISKVWDKLTDTQQARVSEILGGTRQLQVISSIINNWSDAANAYSTAMNSAGAATKANEVYMETAAAHIEQFKAAFQELSRTLVDTGLVSTIVDFGAGVLSAIGGVTSFISKLGGLKTILAAVGAYLIMAKAETIAFYIELAKEVILEKTVSLFKAIKTGFHSFIQIIPNAITAWKNYAAGTAAAGATMEATIPVIGLVLAAITALVAGLSIASNAAREARQTSISTAQTAAAEADDIMKLAAQYSSLSNAVDEDGSAKESLLRTQNDLIQKLQLERTEVEKLIEKYGDYTKAIKAATLAEIKKKQVDMASGMEAAGEELVNEAKPGLLGRDSYLGSILMGEEIEDEEIAVLRSAGFSMLLKSLYSNVGLVWEPIGNYDLSTAEGVSNAFYELQSAMSALTDAGLEDSYAFSQLNKVYSKLSGVVDDYNDSVQNYNKSVADEIILTYELNNSIPKTQSEFESFKKEIISIAEDTGRFKGSSIEIASFFDNYLSSLADYEKFYQKLDNASGGDSLAHAASILSSSAKEFADNISSLKSNYDLLSKAQKEINENGGLSADTIKSLADANENYLDYLYEENGQIKLNAKAWADFAGLQMRQQIAELTVAQDRLKVERDILQAKIDQMKASLAAAASDDPLEQLKLLPQQAAVAQMEQRVTELNEAINENQSAINLFQVIYDSITSSAENVAKAIDSLSSYDRIIDSFASVAEAIKGVNDEFKSLAELQVAVADGFKMSQEEALKYAEVYPEILDGATLAANGEIELNENVVNNFIRGKRAELEASIQKQIDELNAKRQMMLAIQQFAKTELEIAQGVANGEATISANVDQLRADNRNALTNALAEMGVQEVEQNKIASAAMTGNYTEVDRVTAEVASDMAKNLGTAASSAADDIQTNMYNARRDISAVAKQVGKTATAIRQMPRGVWKNEYGEIELGSRGGSGYTPIDTHVSSGSFNGISNGYDYVSVTLNNYIDNLTHQIDSYTDAINNIDGQIKLLESIKEHAFEIFRKQAEEAAKNNNGKSSSGKNSSSGSDKGDNWFEAQYKLYQHLLKMDAAETEDYLHWLEWAYQEAYNQGIITLDQYFSYQEETFKGLRDLFKDYLSDLEHQISMRENFDGETDEILKIYEELLAAVTAEIHKAQEQGLDDNDDWLQELQTQYWRYFNAIKDLRDDVTKNAKDSVEELVQIRIKMLKEEIQREKDAIKERLDALKKFYQKQKDMLQDQYDEEKYLREQSEKRNAVQDIMAELAQLEFDNSAWAEKRKLELRQKLAEAQQDLDDFERDHALETAKDELDRLYEMQEEELENQNKLLEEKENDAQALYQQALEDIKNGSIELYEEMIRWNEEYGDGIEDTIKDAWEAAYKALQDYMDLYGEYYNGVHLANATGYQGNGSWDDHFAHTPPSSGSSGNSEAPSPGDTGAGGGGSGSSGSSSPSSSSYPYGKASETTGIIKKGSEGTDVKAIQYALKKLGYKDGNGKALVIDGKFGAKTEAAVKKFQKAMGLDPNGKVGDKTRKKFKKKGYYTGTSFASPGLHPFEEFGTETTFESNDGTRYKMFTGGEKVLTAKQSDFLYKFATNGARVLEQFMQALTGKGMPNVGQPINHYEIRMGDITINGSANQETVSQMRRAQRESVDFMLKELNKLNAR